MVYIHVPNQKIIGIKITVLKAIKTIYIQKIAQVAAACNPESNAASLPNQRVRSSLNYR